MKLFAWSSFRRWVYNHLENEQYDSFFSRVLNYLLIGLIVTNVAAVIFESVNQFYLAYQWYFDHFELMSIGIFSIEFLLRLWSISEQDAEQPAWKQRLQWLMSWGAIIDLIAILPAFINYFVPFDLRFLRVLRLLRLLKLTRYFISLQILLAVIKREKGSFQAVLFILSILIIMAAGVLYFVEHKAQPEHFGSIPQAMWWSVVTLTTVGYGDVTPVTDLGKILGAIITILGVGIAALPAGILATGLANELNLRNQLLEQQFREALLSQKVDLVRDQATIEQIRRQIGLPYHQTHEIIVHLMREHLIESNQKLKNFSYHYCPNCGEKVTKDTDIDSCMG